MVKDAQDAAVKGYERDHQDLERDDHGCDHQAEQGSAGLPLVTDNDIGGHCRKQQGEYGREDRDACRVCKGTPERHFVHGIREVLQRESVCSDQCQRIRGDISLDLEYVNDNKYKREDKQDEQNDQKDDLQDTGDLRVAGSFFV